MGTPEHRAPLLADEDILLLGGGEWDLCPREPDFLGVLARHGTRTLVLESPGMRTPSLNVHDLARIGTRLGRARRMLEARGDGVHALTPLTLPFPGSALARRINAAIQAWAVRRSLKRLRFRRPIVLITSPIFNPLLDLVDARLVVYDCHDDWTAFPGVDGALFGRLEAELLRRADVVFAASDALRRAKAPLREDILLLRNGVDPAPFSGPLPDPPADLAAIPGPRLGYVGNIYSRLDTELLCRIAEARPDWAIVLIGLVRSPLGRLTTLPNVHVLGRKPKNRLPAYMRHLDCGLLPHRSDALTETQDPTKIYEYLAAGLPVVATDLTPLEAFEGCLTRVSADRSFEDAISEALADDSEDRRAERREMASRHTWQRRAETFSAGVLDRLPDAAR